MMSCCDFLFLFNLYAQAFSAQNYESAKSRLAMCTEDIRDQLGREGNTPELCSQLGAVLGMLGDCRYDIVFFFCPKLFISKIYTFSSFREQIRLRKQRCLRMWSSIWSFMIPLPPYYSIDQTDYSLFVVHIDFLNLEFLKYVALPWQFPQLIVSQVDWLLLSSCLECA